MPVTCTEPPTFPQTRPSHPTRPSASSACCPTCAPRPQETKQATSHPRADPRVGAHVQSAATCHLVRLPRLYSPCSPPQSSSPHWTGGESEERRESPNARARRALFWCCEFARTGADRQVYHLEGRGWRRPGPPESQENGGQHWSRADVHVWN